ncbi:MAG TPA: WxcM-like domain-containing protein [Solirubrobacteraceae bacterium]|jgi:acetyltransferase-like isoleucine patch superfamily enzyme/dTDP-4-dehydrorhamnose 3,5-epimerase-like enzyme|nr:WxcM-like domain-containing protein [Solirubrobacteraceae bacterium]
MAGADLLAEPLEAPRHPSAICAGAEIGAGTTVGAFAHVAAGARIGVGCRLGEHVLVQGDVVIGDRVTVEYGVAVWDGLRIEDDVLVGPNVAFTNRPLVGGGGNGAGPRRTTVCAGASLGANCTILPGLRIGTGAVVGAGSVLTRDVPPHAIVAGNPARIVGYADTAQRERSRVARVQPLGEDGQWPQHLRVEGVLLYRLTRADDLRGSLVSGEVSCHIPFQPLRFFTIMEVPSKDVRGEHAHRRCEQFLVCQSGSVLVVLDDGSLREEVLLDDPGIGLYIPPLVWGTQYRYTSDSLLLVLASRAYEPEDYIRDYDEFLELRHARPAETSKSALAG